MSLDRDGQVMVTHFSHRFNTSRSRARG